MSTLTVTSLYDSGPGTLRSVIGSASDGDKIVFSPALDGGTISLVNPIYYGTSLDIEGPGAGLLKISGGSATNLLVADEPTTDETIAGLTLTQAYGAGGAAFYGDVDAATFRKCAFVGDVAQPSFPGSPADGGALEVFANTLTIQGCTFSGNDAQGAYLADNSAYGGAIYAVAQNLTIAQSTFANNHAVGTDGDPQAGSAFGGALFAQAENNQVGPLVPSVTLSGDTFTGNLALSGNGTMVDDQAGLAEGGGVEIDAGTTQGLAVGLTGDKFTSNEAMGGVATFAGPAEGGGLYLDADLASSPTFTATGNLFSSSQAVGGAVSGNTSGNYVGEGGIGYGGDVALDASLSSNAAFLLSSNQVTYGVALGGAGGATTFGNTLPGLGGDARGGGIYADASSASAPRFILSATTLAYNSAIAGGNAAQSNEASFNPGAIAAGGGYDASAGYSAAPYFTLDGSTVAYNRVTGGAGGSITLFAPGQGDQGGNGFGGGVALDPGYSAGATYNITRDTFQANTATGGAGGSSGFGPDFNVGYTGGAGGSALGGGLVIVPDIETDGTHGDGLATGLKITVGRSSFANNRTIGGTGGTGGSGINSGPGGAGATSLGGAIGIFGVNLDPTSTITLDTDTLAGNMALGGKGGGGGYGVNDIGSGGDGGAAGGGGLYVDSPATVDILHGLMTRNKAAGGAGGAEGTGASGSGGAGSAGLGYGGGAYILPGYSPNVFATIDTRILMNMADVDPDVYGTITFH